MSDFKMPLLLCGILFLCLTISRSLWVENRGLWYYISQDESPVTYQEATSRCESMNARLAVITNQDQNNFIKNRSEDGIQRWIGLSNNKHGYTNTNCKRNPLVWNYDFDCYIKFKIFAHGPYISESASCMGVVLKDGIWSLKSCTEVYGFICQWECKKMYLQFDNLKRYSGIYTLSHYWGGDIVYRKQDTDDVIDLLKSGDTDWVITIQQRNIKAIHQSRLYVPYGESTNWKTPEGKSMSYNFFCIECNKLSICVNAGSDEERCYSLLTLTFDDNSNPEFNDETSDVIIRHHYNAYYCICVDQQSNCDHRCGYIFPYPKRTTTTTLNDRSKVAITNLCIQEHASPSDDKGQWTTALPNDAKAQWITATIWIPISIISLLAVILISAIIWKRRHSHANTETNIYYNDPQRQSTNENRAMARAQNDDTNYENIDQPIETNPNVGEAFGQQYYNMRSASPNQSENVQISGPPASNRSEYMDLGARDTTSAVYDTISPNNAEYIEMI